jgi:hypothetical protein
MLTNIIYFPSNHPLPPRPTSALPIIWRYIAFVVAYVRIKQADFKLPIVLPQQWGINRVLDVSIHGITASDGDRVAGVRRAMDAKRPRMSIVDIAGQMTLEKVA